MGGGELDDRLSALPGVVSCVLTERSVVLVVASGADARLLKARAEVVCADAGEERPVDVRAAPAPAVAAFPLPGRVALRRADRPLVVATASAMALVAIALLPVDGGPSRRMSPGEVASSPVPGSPGAAGTGALSDAFPTRRFADPSASGSLPSPIVSEPASQPDASADMARVAAAGRVGGAFLIRGSEVFPGTGLAASSSGPATEGAGGGGAVPSPGVIAAPVPSPLPAPPPPAPPPPVPASAPVAAPTETSALEPALVAAPIGPHRPAPARATTRVDGGPPVSSARRSGGHRPGAAVEPRERPAEGGGSGGAAGQAGQAGEAGGAGGSSGASDNEPERSRNGGGPGPGRRR